MFAAAGALAVTGSGSATVSYVVDGDTLALETARTSASSRSTRPRSGRASVTPAARPRICAGSCRAERASVSPPIHASTPSTATGGSSAMSSIAGSTSTSGWSSTATPPSGSTTATRPLRGSAARGCTARAGREARALGRLQDGLEPSAPPPRSRSTSAHDLPGGAMRRTRPCASLLLHRTWTARTSDTGVSRSSDATRTTSTVTTTASAARANKSLASVVGRPATIAR